MVEKAKTSEIEINIEELDKWIQENKETLRKGKPYTEEEDAILIKYYPTVPNKIIVKYLPGRSPEGIQHRANKLGIVKK